jgi:hypothetical protein
MNKTITFTARNGETFVMDPQQDRCYQCGNDSTAVNVIPIREYDNGKQSEIKSSTFTIHVCDTCDMHYLSVYAINNREFLNVFPGDAMDGLAHYIKHVSNGRIARALRESRLSVVPS